MSTVSIIHDGKPTDMEIVSHDPETQSVVLRDPLTDERVTYQNGYPHLILEDRGKSSRDEHGKPNQFRDRQLTRGEIEAAMAGP